MIPFDVLAEEAEGLYAITEVERIPPPSPLEFYREYVAQNKPVIIQGGISQWKALTQWDNQYLRNVLKDFNVTVAVTPNGRADAVVDDKYFVKPIDKLMKFSDFMDILEKKVFAGPVHYIQHQNSNFSTEFQQLWKDIDVNSLSWAQEAFGAPPDAINFWMGDESSVTSLHKDHYENIYCVIAGEKHFTLFPPTDYPILYEKEYISATYVEENGNFRVVEDTPPLKVPWISIDPIFPNLPKYPKFSKAKPIRCTVKAGEVLYLPSLYFHHVTQQPDENGRVIAVNFWYDMKFGLNYVYYKFLEACVRNSTD